MKKIYIPLIICALFIIAQKPLLAQKHAHYDERSYARAKITDIKKVQVKSESAEGLLETQVHLIVLDGQFKGQKKTAIFRGEDNLPKDMFYKKGDTVFIGISTVGYKDPEEYISLYDIDNSKSIIVLGILLAGAIISIGRIKGFLSLIALIVTIFLLFTVLIPLTLKGYAPLPIAILISIISIVITLPIIAGLKRKTAAAILGATSGIVLASVMALIFGFVMHLSGIVTNDMLTVFYASDIKIDLRGLALSGMIIAALGAIMDVSISISSSTAEIYQANPDLDRKEAFKSVLNIGTDILGSMVNTLILAYVGSSLSLILLISMRFEPEMPFWMILNYNPVLSEIVKSVVGSIGMFLSIPITALIAVKLYSGKD